ncbi:MAG: hypothetical protein ABI824_06600 [Acidobacteriota bacterium]
MKTSFTVGLFLLTASTIVAADAQWVLDRSTLTYHVSHILHESEGVSHSARGKGTCHNGQCDFLIAVPVKSFDSGDSNRDLHMIQVTRGSEFPLVSVRTHLPEAMSGASTILVDLDVEFGGQKVHYKQIAFERVAQGTQTKISGTVPLALSDFRIDPPKLLTVAVKNEVPLKVELVWHVQ